MRPVATITSKLLLNRRTQHVVELSMGWVDPWVGSSWVEFFFQFLVGWVGLGQSADGLGWIGSHKMDPRTTLACRHRDAARTVDFDAGEADSYLIEAGSVGQEVDVVSSRLAGRHVRRHRAAVVQHVHRQLTLARTARVNCHHSNRYRSNRIPAQKDAIEQKHTS